MDNNILEVIRFWTETKPGRNPVDFVELASRTAISPQGMRTHTVVHRVRDLKPREDTEEMSGDTLELIRARWAIVGAAYEAWKSGQELPTDGTPIAAWSTLTPVQADALRMAGLTTIERVANAHESQISAVRVPNASVLREAAKQWLASQDVEAKNQQITNLESRMAEMLEMLAAQQRQIEDAMATPEPKKRGRPAKVAEPEEEPEPELDPDAGSLFGEG